MSFVGTVQDCPCALDVQISCLEEIVHEIIKVDLDALKRSDKVQIASLNANKWNEDTKPE